MVSYDFRDNNLLMFIRTLYGSDIGRDGVKKVEGGFLSRNFVLSGGGGRVFLKCYRFDDLETVMTIHRVKALFAEGGFPVVRPIVNAKGETIFTHEGEIYAVFPFVEGRSLTQETLAPSEAASAGELLGRLHKWSVEQPAILPLKPVSHWSQDKYLAESALIEEQLGMVKNPDAFDQLAIEVLDNRRRLVLANKLSYEDLRLPMPIITHGDYHIGNLFFGDGGVSAMFDFEKAEYVSPTVELARAVMLSCLNGTSTDNKYENARAFVAAYRETCPTPEETISEGFRNFLVRLYHSTWILKEHYLKENRRVDCFLINEAQWLKMDHDDLVKKILS